MSQQIQAKTTRVVLAKHARTLASLLDREREEHPSVQNAVRTLLIYTAYHAPLHITSSKFITKPMKAGPNGRPTPTAWDTQHVGHLAQDLIESLDRHQPDREGQAFRQEAWEVMARLMTALAVHTPGGNAPQYPLADECLSLDDRNGHRPI